MLKNLYVALMVSCTMATAQVSQTGRCVITPKDEYTNYKIAPVDSLGLIVYSYQKGDLFDQLEVIQLDTSLNELGRGYIPLEKNSEILLSYISKKSFYLLLKKSGTIDYLIIDYKIESGKYITYPIINALPFTPTEFKCSKEGAWIAQTDIEQTSVVYFSFRTQKSKVLPGQIPADTKLCELNLNQDGSSDLIFKETGKKNLVFLRYSADGDLIDRIILEPKEGFNLSFGRSYRTAGKLLITGIYGNQEEYARGIFTSVWPDTKGLGIQYFEFSQLPNFVEHLNRARQKRIKKRMENNQDTDKTKLIDQFVIQNLVPYHDQLLLIGEAFETRITSTPIRIFRGIRANKQDEVWYDFTYTFVTSLNTAGDINWNENFEMNISSLTLKPFVKVVTSKNKMGFFHLNQNQLHFEEFKDGHLERPLNKILVLSSLKYSPSQNKDTPPELTYGTLPHHENEVEYLLENEDKTAHLDNWYGNHFLAYGNQIQKTGKGWGAKSSKRVFSINKISYQ